MERISGPHEGYFLACYTVAGCEGVFAYAKICLQRPLDVWQAAAVDKVAVGPYLAEQPALAAVQSKAHRACLRKRRTLSGSWPT